MSKLTEIQRDEKINDLFFKKLIDKMATFTPVHKGIQMNYVIADSIDRDYTASDLTNGTFAFKLGVKGIMRSGYIGWESKSQKITYIRVHPFNIPVPSALAYPTSLPQAATSTTPALAANGASKAVIPLLSHIITMEIRELSSQGIYQERGNRYHFQFTPESHTDAIAGDYISLTPINDKYILADPVDNMYSLTCVFRNPYVPVSFLTDTISNATAYVYNLGGTQVVAFATTQSNLLAAGDYIYIIGFNSVNVNINQYLTRNAGVIVGAAPIPASTNTFSLNPAVSAAPYGLADGAPIPAGDFKIIIIKNRIRIPLMFGSITEREMPYIALTP